MAAALSGKSMGIGTGRDLNDRELLIFRRDDFFVSATEKNYSSHQFTDVDARVA